MEAVEAAALYCTILYSRVRRKTWQSWGPTKTPLS